MSRAVISPGSRAWSSQACAKGSAGSEDQAKRSIGGSRLKGTSTPTLAEVQQELPPRRRDQPVRVIFVGGAERQEQCLADLDASIAARYNGMVSVDWFFPGWSANWYKAAERVEAAYEEADAVVLMTLVRTNFGRWVRRTAGEHGLSWVSCTGQGRGAMERAIDRAIRLARDTS
ncbi:MAG TPA: hypothetical protein VK988_04740 [Acidimicrobiales bacterium]|nr:hypothetical protein [Acidimicrobiales bacterium]